MHSLALVDGLKEVCMLGTSNVNVPLLPPKAPKDLRR